MSSVTVLHNYYKQYSAFCSYNQLKEMLYTGTTKDSIQVVTKDPHTTKTVKAITTKKTRKPTKQVETQSINIIHNPNDIITINNDQYFAIIFNNFRKQKSPLAYAYFNTNSSSLKILIKNPIGFPIIDVNIPNDITKQNLHINTAYINDDKCYQLPLTDEIFKPSAAKAQSYVIKYMLEDSKIKFSYQYILSGNKPTESTTDNIKDISLKVLFNNFISDKVDRLGMVCSDKDFDALTKLNNMTLNIIAQQNGADIFNTTDSTRSKNRIVINDDELNFIQQNTARQSVQQLCDKDNSVRWNTNFNGIIPNEKGEFEFELFEFSSMFKNNYNKQLLINDNSTVYYAFGQFYEDIYVLARIITPKEIDADSIQAYNIANIFNDDFTTKELYICRTINVFKK